MSPFYRKHGLLCEQPLYKLYPMFTLNIHRWFALSVCVWETETENERIQCYRFRDSVVCIYFSNNPLIYMHFMKMAQNSDSFEKQTVFASGNVPPLCLALKVLIFTWYFGSCCLATLGLQCRIHLDCWIPKLEVEQCGQQHYWTRCFRNRRQRRFLLFRDFSFHLKNRGAELISDPCWS